MAIKVTIPIRLPGLNEYVDVCRGNKYEAANFKRQIEDDCLIFIKAALRGRTLKSIGFRWFEKNRQRDKDNICKTSCLF